MTNDIRFQETRDIHITGLHSLFLSEQWNDFMTEDEVQFYLDTALYVVTAWQEDSVIGFGRLEGDGRISVEISDVLVRSDLQGSRYWNRTSQTIG